MSARSMVAGALFDFVGRLTTLEEPITLGRQHEPHRVLDELEAFASERGLPLDEADVQNWQEEIR